MAANRFVIVSASAVAVFSALLLNSSVLPWWGTRSSFEFADLVVRNATIFTADTSLPFAEAMAVRNGRILRVGDYSSIQDLVDSKTHVMNLEGKVVVPGFIDSHVHFINGGLQVWLSRMDGHMGLANFLALKIAGITNETQDPVGGNIFRTSAGEPTGLLVDSAMKLVVSLIPELSTYDRRDALVRASKHALSRGVTMVNDFGRFVPGTPGDLVWQDFSDVYRWADSMGKMLIRVSLFFPMQTWSRLIDLVQKNGRALSEKIYLGGVKAFADGSLGSNSALFYEPYVDDPDYCGLQVAELNWLLNVTSASDKYGLQVAIHAIGDKANDMILDLYDTVVSLNGLRDRRFRVEHAQHLAAGAPARFGQQEVIASVQPLHLLDDADSAVKKIGAYRANTGSYLFQSLITNSAQLAFGSDWPVADINPLGAIKTAMTRIPPGWETAWIPSQCVSFNDALTASTISAARASFIDGDLGSLSSGKFADFVVLSVSSWDAFSKNPTPSILATYVGGVQAYP